MKWSVIATLVVACQVENPDSSTVQSGGDSSVEAVNITAENSYAEIKITTDQPLKAGEEGTLRIKFTAKKNLQSRTVTVENAGSGEENAEGEQPQTYQQRPVMSLAYTSSQPQIEADESNDQIPHIDSSSTRRVSLNDMEAGSSFTLVYKVTAEQSFFIEAKLDVAGETEKFTSGSDDYYRHSKLQISVDSPKTINPDDYATVEITKDTYDAKPAVKIKVTPKVRTNASKIEKIVTKFRDTNYHSRSQAECSGQGVNACGDGTTLTSAFATGNGITIHHPLNHKPPPNEATRATVEVKFILEDGTEIVAGSDTLSWTATEVQTIVASAPAAASVQGGSSENKMVYNHQEIAKINFTAINHQISHDGAPKLRVTLTALRDIDSGWNALQEGARLHLTFPVRYAFEKYESNGNKVEHRKAEIRNRWEKSDLYTTKEEGMSREWFSSGQTHEFKFKRLVAGTSIVMLFQLAKIGESGNTPIDMRASMDITEDNDVYFRHFGSVNHSVSFTGGCTETKKTQLRDKYHWTDRTTGSFRAYLRYFNNASNSQYYNMAPNGIGVSRHMIIGLNNNARLNLGDNSNNDETHELIVRVGITADGGTRRRITSFGSTTKEATINDNYAEYKFEVKDSGFIAPNSLNLHIPIFPKRDGSFDIDLLGRRGRNSKNLVSFNFKVAPHQSCLFD